MDDFLVAPTRGAALKLHEPRRAEVVLVEVQDAAGHPLPGCGAVAMPPLSGDELDATVRWPRGADLPSLQGQPVRQRFVLPAADVFALHFAE